MVCFAVDQQTALVESGEKPTVTPAMLGAWVAFLADSGEPDCAAIGAKVRAEGRQLFCLPGRGMHSLSALATRSPHARTCCHRPPRLLHTAPAAVPRRAGGPQL